MTSSHQKNSRTLLSPYKMRSLLRLTTRLAHSFGKLSFATPHLTPLEAPRKLSNPRARNKKNASVYVLAIAVLRITICWGNHSNQRPDTISLISDFSCFSIKPSINQHLILKMPCTKYNQYSLKFFLVWYTRKFWFKTWKFYKGCGLVSAFPTLWFAGF